MVGIYLIKLLKDIEVVDIYLIRLLKDIEVIDIYLIKLKHVVFSDQRSFLTKQR